MKKPYFTIRQQRSALQEELAGLNSSSVRTTPSHACRAGLRRSFGLTLLAFFSTLSSAQAVGTRHFVVDGQSDFEAGELEQASINSDGFLLPGFQLSFTEISEASVALSVLETPTGLLIGTAPDAKLLRFENGETKEVVQADGLGITSITQAFGKKIIVAVSPGNQLYELKGDELEPFSELKDAKHIAALSYDEKSQSLFAATGPNGQLFRITAAGAAQVYFDAEEAHLVSVATHDGLVLTGSSEEARIYSLSGPGRATVLYDFSATEVAGIDITKEGAVYAIVNTIKGGPKKSSHSPIQMAHPKKQSARKGSGELWYFSPSGQPDKLWSSSKEVLRFLATGKEGNAVVGTGKDGRLLRVTPTHETTLLSDIDQRQVAFAAIDDARGFVVGSDPIVVHKVDGQGGRASLWTSQVLDAGIRAHFGQLDFISRGKVEFSTRSGNTKEPDATWESWSSALSQPGTITSAPGRYLQIRARLTDGVAAHVERVSAAYVTDNLRAIVTSVEAKSNASVEGSTGIQSSGGPIDSKHSSKLSLSWKVTNPDKDKLRYFIEYQRAGTNSWFNALPDGKIHTKTKLDWNTKNLEEGNYRIRITASDELANSPQETLKDTRISRVVAVDNTAPRIENLQVKGTTVTGRAVDAVGPIGRIEVQINGQGEWIPFSPNDGIFDRPEENFTLLLGTLVETRSMVSIRVLDAAGNAVVQSVVVNPQP
ncbi:MAG: hypothetical protein MK135_05125 [Polyangiaceae bacterium]|nr:hypothetical protein [Polyangiaceae bacterium]